jgi:hypothetical protein
VSFVGIIWLRGFCLLRELQRLYQRSTVVGVEAREINLR